MKKDAIPGLIAIAALACLSMLVAQYAGKPLMAALHLTKVNPLEATTFAIILGFALRNLKLLPTALDPGLKHAEKPLIWGVIVLGATLNFFSLVKQGSSILATIIVTMGVGFLVIYLLARALRLPQKLSILLGVGTTICGTSAIAVTAPLIEAQQEDTSYAVTTISLWGLVALLTYPYLAMAASVSDQAFGVFAGTAIHATPQVVGAGYVFSEAAGNVATAVKMVRNCFMVPLAMVIALWYARKQAATAAHEGRKLDWTRAFPWFLFGFFLMAILGTKGFFTPTGLDWFKRAGAFLVLMGMAGIGMNTRLSSFKGIGVKPFVVGLIGAIIVAIVSILMIWLLHLYTVPA